MLVCLTTWMLNTMVNNAFLAKTASDELADTLFFGGFEYTKERSKPNGVLTYTYTTPKFVLTISGRNIRIGNEKFKRVYEAKRKLQQLIDI